MAKHTSDSVFFPLQTRQDAGGINQQALTQASSCPHTLPASLHFRLRKKKTKHFDPDSSQSYFPTCRFGGRGRWFLQFKKLCWIYCLRPHMTAAETSARCAAPHPSTPRHAHRGMLMDICLLSVSGWPGAEPRVAVSQSQSGAALRVEKKTLTETLVSKWSLLLEVILLLRRCRDQLPACFTAGCQVVSLFMCLGAKVRAQAFFLSVWRFNIYLSNFVNKYSKNNS